MLVLIAAFGMTATADATPRDTTVRTIQDTDEPADNLLEFAPGEDHCVFAFTLVPSNPDCEAGRLTNDRPDSILNFLQLSDFQVVDEESPARVEMLDTTQRAPGLQPFSAAYRPQESLTSQITEAMVRQARNTTSPITGERLALTVLTGDNADSQQYNETRWFIDILDGTTGGEDPDPEMNPPAGGHKIHPDSGIEGSPCPGGQTVTDNESVYDGVRDSGATGPDPGYYEPDGEGDGDGYTPRREQNQAETGRDVTVRDFPGLLERAQEPFEAVGLGMPWYSAFGNHDALVQGNSGDAYKGPFAVNPVAEEDVNPAFDAIARGCVKPTKLAPGVSPETYLRDPSSALLNPAGFASLIVPPDPRRCFVAKDEPNTGVTPCDTGGWIQQHSRTTGLPAGHGFTPFTVDGQAGSGRPATAVEAHDGYYSFSPKPKVRFIVLDTITDECGLPVCAEGSVDETQFRWLDEQLTEADTLGEYVLVFSHHTLRTTRMFSSDVSEYPLHFGGRTVDPEGEQPEGTSLGESLEELFCRHSSVVGHVNGHEHQNDVLAHRCEDSVVKNPFVEVITAAHIDWPQQSRTIELLDDGGTLSLALTILDHDGPPNPGNGNAGEQPVKLASIGREIAYNDYQGSRGARGEPSDRNVIVATDKPWPPQPAPPQPAP
jgi:hypothetical protein